MADPWAEFRIAPTAPAQQGDPWAEFRVKDTAAQPEPDIIADAGGQIVRGINRGMNSIVALPGEIVGGAINMVAPGQGDRFKWRNPVSEFMTSPDVQPQTDAGRDRKSTRLNASH